MEVSYLRYIFTVIIILLLLAGCANQKSENNSLKYAKPIQDKSSLTRFSENEKAKKIANNILKVQGIKKVVVVVSGKTALIGLNIDKKDKNRSEYFKNIAIQKTNDIDTSISDIKVTLDDDMYNRINKLNEDISSGSPLSGVIRDFKKIFKNINIINK